MGLKGTHHDASVRHFLNLDLNFSSVLLEKLYFDLCFSINKKSRFSKMSEYKCQSKDFEVSESKYRKGRTDARFLLISIGRNKCLTSPDPGKTLLLLNILQVKFIEDYIVAILSMEPVEAIITYDTVQ